MPKPTVSARSNHTSSAMKPNLVFKRRNQKLKVEIEDRHHDRIEYRAELERD